MTAPYPPTLHDHVAFQALQAGGGDYFRPGFYSIGGPHTPQSTRPLGVNTLHLRPFIVPVRRAFDRIGINVTSVSAASSGGVLRLGLYGPGGAPGTLLLDAGTVSSEGTQGGREVVITQTLEPGVWWLAMVAQVAGCTVSAAPSAAGNPYFHAGTSPPGNSTGWYGATGGSTTSGALPTNLSSLAADTGNVPFSALRAA